MMKKTILLLSFMVLLAACGGELTTHLPPTAAPFSTATATAMPVPIITSTPIPPALTPYPPERLVFANTSKDEEVAMLNFGTGRSILFEGNSDGSELAEMGLLPDDTRLTVNLSVSPDGQFLLFNKSNFFGGDTNSDLYLADLQNRTVITLTLPNTVHYWEPGRGTPSWSPDSRYLAYTADVSEASKFTNNIFIWDRITGNLKQITSGENFVALFPSWSPDGQWIAFLKYEQLGYPAQYNHTNYGTLFLVKPDGTELRPLLDKVYINLPGNGRGDDLYNEPAWSPNSQRIAYLTGNTAADIGVVNVVDGDTKLLVSGPSQESYPAWSPDGNYLAFVTDRDGNDEIYTVALESGELKNLTQNPGSDFVPVWSPSSHLIAFLSQRNSAPGYQLFSMQEDGTHLVQITEDTFVLSRSAWLISQ